MSALRFPLRLTRCLALAVAALAALPLAAEEIVLTVSTREVAITSTYAGADVTVFGIIERDAQTIARPGGYEVVASVQGPRGDIVVQEKDRFGPVWLTAARKRYQQVPLFFSVLSARPLPEITDQRARETLKLGLEFFLPPVPTNDPRKEAEELGFRDATLRLQRGANALRDDYRAITMVRPNVFSVKVTLPATAPVGLYVVNVSVLSEGIPLKTQQAGFVVRKVGFDAFVAESARNHPLIYGLVTIAMAILLGWLANIVFRKD
jgi:uncharacterized protein (TIGR02186 family)